jgi:hypothetical protein
MSKLARTLVLAAMVSAMSLGMTGLSQAAVLSQQTDTASPTPSQSTPTDPTTPTTPQPDPTPPAPGPTTTTTTRPPVVRPTALPVTVFPRAGSAGATVTVRADLRACVRPNSAAGFFEQAHEWGVDALSRTVTYESIDGRSYTGQYRVSKRDSVGLGRFGVVCDNSIVGYATFQVQPSNPRVSVRVTPQAGGPGTVVRITAQVGQCRYYYAYFYDSKAQGVTIAGGAKPIRPLHVSAGTLTTSYTVTNKDATGPARFSVGCGIGETANFGEASFHVSRVRSEHPNSGNPSDGGATDDGNAKRVQFPTQIDTGLGGTADRGLDPAWLLLPAGLLLLAVAVGLRLRQTNGTRRQ